jgi:FtsH-binding integral membrane protein
LSLGIDEALVRDVPGAVATSAPGRMGVNTALAFVLVGAALLMLDAVRPRAIRTGQSLALAGGMLAWTALVGYLYSVAALYRLASYTAMALSTALTFIPLVLGTLAARADRGSWPP